MLIFFLGSVFTRDLIWPQISEFDLKFDVKLTLVVKRQYFSICYAMEISHDVSNLKQSEISKRQQ